MPFKFPYFKAMATDKKIFSSQYSVLIDIMKKYELFRMITKSKSISDTISYSSKFEICILTDSKEHLILNLYYGIHYLKENLAYLDYESTKELGQSNICSILCSISNICCNRSCSDIQTEYHYKRPIKFVQDVLLILIE